MIHVFYPYWSDNTGDFNISMAMQNVTYSLHTCNRKKSGVLWTKAVADFQENLKAPDDDIVIVMNNDIKFHRFAFQMASLIGFGEVYIPDGCYVSINWKHKKFAIAGNSVNSFLGRFFVMKVRDFKSIKFCRLLPHALADIDFGIRAVKKFNVFLVDFGVVHPNHAYEQCRRFSLRSYDNPFLWTVFLLRHINRYTLLNIIKSLPKYKIKEVVNNDYLLT